MEFLQGIVALFYYALDWITNDFGEDNTKAVLKLVSVFVVIPFVYSVLCKLKGGQGVSAFINMARLIFLGMLLSPFLYFGVTTVYKWWDRGMIVASIGLIFTVLVLVGFFYIIGYFMEAHRNLFVTYKPKNK